MIKRAMDHGALPIQNPFDIYTFTIGQTENHPDIQHAKMVTKSFSVNHFILIPDKHRTERAKERLKNELSSLGEDIGTLGVFMLYEFLKEYNVKMVIAHDGIDELMGGYWIHRQDAPNEEKMEAAFRNLWGQLKEKHLIPLETIAQYFGIRVIFPYLQKDVVECISRIPVLERTGHEVSKIPLRRLAEKYLPREIIERPKIGFCDALKKF